MKSTIEIRELASKASHNITSRLVWHTALKDQAGIAQSLADGKDIQEIYGLGEAALFDEFFCFLDQLGIKPLAMKLKPKIKKKRNRDQLPYCILDLCHENSLRISPLLEHTARIAPIPAADASGRV